MAVLKNRAKMSTSTTGTGTITLGSAESGYQTFADAGVANADVVRYVIEDTGGAFEIGTGTYTATGTTLSRTVSESSNADAAINLSGSATVFIGATAEDIPETDLFAQNYDGTSTKPSATGTNTIAMGVSAVAGAATDGIAIGRGANCGTATQNISIGAFSSCGFNSKATALGRGAQATGGSSLALGVDSVSAHDKSVAIGKSNSNGDDSFAAQIVNNTTSYGAQGNNSIAIGQLAKATAANSVAIGDTATSTTANQIALGGTTDTVKISGTYTLPTTDGTTGQVLTTDGSGAVTFADASSVGGSVGVDFNDNVKARFGTGNDLEIYHGTDNHSYIKESGSGNLRIMGQNLRLQNASGADYLEGISGGAVNIMHNSNTKLATTSSGIQTTGTVNVNGAYTLPTADGSANQVLTTDGSGAVTFADAGGGGADLYAANESSPAAQPSATGANAIAIGDSAIASDVDAFAGPLSRAAGDYSVALGVANNSSSYGAGGSYSISIGYQSRAMALQSVALGAGAYVDSDSSRGLALGENSYVQQCDYGTAIGAAARVHGGNSATEATAFGSSYASGTSSFAAAIANNTSSYGSSGANSIAMGKLAKATAASSIAIGESNTANSSNAIAMGYNSTASAAYATCIGRSGTASGQNSSSLGGRSGLATGESSTTVGGRSNKAYADYAVAMGYWTLANKIGQFSYASGRFSGDGDAQASKFVLRSDTTDATAEALTTNNSTASTDNQIILPNNSAYSFSGTIIARESAAAGSDYASWEIKGALLRDANAASTVLGNGIQNKLYATSGASAWAIALSADTTNGGLKIEVTGAAATNIRWVATVNTSEVTYA